jgi:hypothetical protein
VSVLACLKPFAQEASVIALRELTIDGAPHSFRLSYNSRTVHELSETPDGVVIDAMRLPLKALFLSPMTINSYLAAKSGLFTLLEVKECFILYLLSTMKRISCKDVHH